MNVASLDLCRELYELSGWDDTTFLFIEGDIEGVGPASEYGYHPEMGDIPAYDLGYLLRKLPPHINERPITISNYMIDGSSWSAAYMEYDQEIYTASADTPEDAAAKLVIELFKQGILTRERKG
jgi:hypothetical protein